MKDWSDDIARQLREPLPSEQVGKLPKIGKNQATQEKRDCRYCGGWHQPITDRQHVDYVSHTITTDRLNTIVGQDGWSHTIDRIQEHGGHVVGILATLTIAGVSKQEAGDPGKQSTWGEEMKLAISDWLPRAAMRFGLGLDVWAKQPLDRVILDDAHEPEQQRRQARPAPGTAAKRVEVGGENAIENGAPTVDAIEWLSKLPSDSQGLLGLRELLMACSTDYRHRVKAAAERRRQSEEGYRQLWNDEDVQEWVATLLEANAQMAMHSGEAA